jgi:hypothetical protein
MLPERDSCPGDVFADHTAILSNNQPERAVSELERIYELQTGRVLEDDELIDTRDAAYGATADWERG